MPKVSDLRAYVVESEATTGSAQPQSNWIFDSVIANPMSVYPAFRESRSSWGIDVFGTVVVEIETDAGIVGVGTTMGGVPACHIIEQHLRRFVVGQDPRNIELIWDQMWRATLPYGRKGLALHAVSAIDLALWDVLGKLRGEPVYALLGGQTHSKLSVYATAPQAEIAQQLGFVGAKLPLPYGPADGREGLAKNIAMVARAREQVGPDFDLMLDCYMALTVSYAIELADAVAPYRVRWLEDFLQPDDYDGYAQVKASARSCLVATGEHEYTRYGFRELIQRRAVDILQPDLTWVGGITEARRIVALAAAYDLPVAVHCAGVFGYHLQVAFPNCPLAEFVMLAPRGDQIAPISRGLLIDEPLPQNGCIVLSDKPGWGVDLNRTDFQLRRPCAVS
jgi:L-rhamnonate dehydratase